VWREVRNVKRGKPLTPDSRDIHGGRLSSAPAVSMHPGAARYRVRQPSVSEMLKCAEPPAWRLGISPAAEIVLVLIAVTQDAKVAMGLDIFRIQARVFP